MGYNQLFSITIQILDELLMMYNILKHWLQQERKIWLSDSVCAYGDTREQSAQWL